MGRRAVSVDGYQCSPVPWLTYTPRASNPQLLLRTIRPCYRLDRPPRRLARGSSGTLFLGRLEDCRVLHRGAYDPAPASSPLHPIPHLALLIFALDRHPPHRWVHQAFGSRKYSAPGADQLGAVHGELQFLGRSRTAHRWVWWTCDHS